MQPCRLREELSQRLSGRILQDVTWHGANVRLGHLAPCCGRLIQGVREISGNGHVWIWLESAQIEDEPPGLLLPAGPVRRVSGCGYTISLYCQDGRLVLVTGPQSGRDRYAIPAVLEPAAAALFMEALQGTGRVTAKATQDALGVSYRRSHDIVAAWERAGWLERRGMYRYVSELGQQLASQIVNRATDPHKAKSHRTSASDGDPRLDSACAGHNDTPAAPAADNVGAVA
jgi:hypothetical protein